MGKYRVPHVYINGTTWYIQGTTCVYTGYHMCIYRVSHVYMQGTTCVYTGYHMFIYRVPHGYMQGTACAYTMYHMCIYKVTSCVYSWSHMCIYKVLHGHTMYDMDYKRNRSYYDLFVNIEQRILLVYKLAGFRLQLRSELLCTTMTFVEVVE
jgi:hypothetical protein